MLGICLFLLFCLVAPSVSGQTVVRSSEGCNAGVLVDTYVKMDALLDEPGAVQRFLGAFGESCAKNVEFMEWANELLFDMLERYPEAALRALSEDMDREFILKEVGSPLLDEDLQSIYDGVREAEVEGESKRLLLEAVRKAAEQEGIDLEVSG